VPPGMHEEWAKRDPIELYSQRLVDEHGFSTDEIEAIRSEVREYVAECAERALGSPMPDPEGACEGVFAESWEPLGDGHAPWSRWQGRNGRHSNGKGSTARSAA